MNKILIAGPSGCGKSTVAWALAQRLNYAWVCLDGYFTKTVNVTYSGVEYKSYEHPECYNHMLMLEQILKVERDYSKYIQGIIIEGFCVLNYKSILNLTNFRFFLDAPHAICVTRRLQRTQGKSPADKSYMVIGEGEALKYVYSQKNINQVTILDASLDTETLLQHIIKIINHNE